MNAHQRTIKKPVSLSGIGLHTGNPSTITFHPAPENYGFRFIRTDIEGNPEIPALVDYVTDIARGTTITHTPGTGTELHERNYSAAVNHFHQIFTRTPESRLRNH